MNIYIYIYIYIYIHTYIHTYTHIVTQWDGFRKLVSNICEDGTHSV